MRKKTSNILKIIQYNMTPEVIEKVIETSGSTDDSQTSTTTIPIICENTQTSETITIEIN